MSLIEDAAAAHAAGMTYGQYMSNRPAAPVQRRIGKRCANCGGPLLGKQLRFCSNECRDAMKAKNARGDVFV